MINLFNVQLASSTCSRFSDYLGVGFGLSRRRQLDLGLSCRIFSISGSQLKLTFGFRDMKHSEHSVRKHVGAHTFAGN